MKQKPDSTLRLATIRSIGTGFGTGFCTGFGIGKLLLLAAALTFADPLLATDPPAALKPAAAKPIEAITEPEVITHSADTRSPYDDEPTATASAAPSSAHSPTAAVDLAALLNGVEDQCRYSVMLERFWRSLMDQESAMRSLHPMLRPAVGPIHVTDHGDYRMYSIPVQGFWRQVPVSQIQFGLGKGNGIHVLLVEFDAAAPVAEAVFAPLVLRSKLAMAADPDNTLEATTDLVIDDGKARLICDLST